MFVKGEPAFLIKDSLIIADLHIGIGYDLWKDGITIPEQTKEMQKRIVDLIKKTKAKELIILGDIKHKVPGLSWEERREIPELLDALSERIKVVIVPGNHDDRLKSLVDVKIEPATGIVRQEYGLLHGHTKPGKQLSRCRSLIIGHNHPIINFKDDLGVVTSRQVWIIGSDGHREIILMPHFNPIIGGWPINEMKSEKELLGPVAKSIDLKHAKAFLLDGTDLGEVKDLRKS